MANNRYSQVKAKRVTKGLAAGAIGGGGSSITTYDSTTDLPLSGVSAGDQAFVTGSNRMYVSNGTGWYSVSLVNTNPSITSVQDSDGGSTPFTLATDGSATVITITASDPEDVPLTYGYSVTSGSLTNGGGTTATVVQGTDSDVNKFTITPSSTEAYEGTFELTFTASDGINQGTNANSFTLQFITIVTNSKYTTLLATTVDTSDNNNITDASTNNHSITVNGDAHAGTVSPYRSGGYSTYFDGSGGYLSIAQTTDTNLTGDFTVECWVYLNEDKNQFFVSKWATTNFGWNLFAYGSDSIVFYTGNSGSVGTLIDFNYNPPLHQWMHVAVSRTSNTISGYVNGTRKIVMGNISSNCTSNTSLTIGGHQPGWSLNGYLRDVRIVNGTGLYSGTSITIPESPLTAITNTKVLLGDLPYFKDQSALNHAITVNGSPSTKPFSPYDYNKYSAADHGGSVYFDGSGDYLQTANPLSLSGDFTVSAWVYPEGASKVQVIASPNLSPNNQFFIDENNFMGTYDGNSTHNAQGFGVKRNAWNYLVWSRSGSSLNMYLNGEQSSNSPAVTNTYNLQNIGILSGANGPMQGYISDLQVKTTSTSAANAAPPTAPPSSTGAALHIKGTDASIIDKSQGSNLKLVANTTGSTTQVKFANTKSMYFDGTGDNIRFDTISLEGNFTLEYWLKLSTYNADAGIFGDTGATNSQQRINHNGTFGKIMLYDDGYVHQTTNCFTQSEAEDWMHIAYSRQNGSFKLYVNGVQKESITSSTVINVNILGAGGYLGGNDHLNGYIQDFRITKGLARYTANFTPPTASLEG
jgi:hypothetical protein